MYHLIAAVVAVTIGVFMSAAGIFYAGSVFTTASGKAQAMQIISSMEQIDAAWTMWENAGNLVSAANPNNTNAGAGSLTLNNYLTAYPQAPSVGTPSTFTGGALVASYFLIDHYGTVANAVAPAAGETANTGIVLLLDKNLGGNACLSIAQASGLIPATATFATVNGGGGVGTVRINGVDITVSTGVTLTTDIDKINAAFRFWCVPLGSPGVGSVLINNVGNAALDNTLYLAYYKHM